MDNTEKHAKTPAASVSEELRAKHERIKDVLKKKYLYIIGKYRDSCPAGNVSFIEKTSPVWVCWWQGEADMPDVVRICYESICRNSGSHPVKLVTKENYTEYVHLPDYIIEKANSGIITITHLSDILRMNLLYEYGGYWMDATILLTKTLLEEKNIEFFTTRTVSNLFYVADSRLAMFLIGGSRYCLFFDFTRTFLHEYWKRENVMIDYFLIDYITALAYDNIPAIKELIDRNGCYMPNIFDTAFVLNKPFEDDKFNRICRNAYFHKLSWKCSYAITTEKGEQTLYGYLLTKLLPEYFGLEHRDMKRIIFYYHYARNTGDKNYIKKADNLLEKVFYDLETEANTADSIYRVGCGIIYLLRNNFIE
jgi:hypothetical protein